MKLKLNLDELSVTSFDTTKPEAEKGTVFGEQCTCYTQCTCPGCPTCANYATCDATCTATCAYTCDDATCNCGTYDYTCEGCTQYDATCNGYGTCGRYPCKQIP